MVTVGTSATGIGTANGPSTAPMSGAPLITRGKPGPRWSVVRLNGLLPASIAGLPGNNAQVGVGPPKFMSGPIFGSRLNLLFAPATPVPSVLLIKQLLTVTNPKISGPVGALFLPTS